MPEVSARDLRRLESLQGRLDKATEDRKALAAERRELRAAVNANARAAAAAERTAQTAATRTEALLAENQSLATRLEEARTDAERTERAAGELREQVDRLQADLTAREAALAEATTRADAADRDRDAAAESLRVAQSQLAGRGIEPVLPARDVAGLVDRLVREMGHAMPGLGVRDGELKLQVAFGAVGEQRGFVVPGAGSSPELRDSVHDLTLRFDRAALSDPERG